MTTLIKVAVIALLASCAVGCVTQSTASYDGALTVTLENDTFTGSDNNYTNGLGVAWVSNGLDTYDDERFVSKWGEFWSFLPGIPDDGSNTYAAWGIAQEMHTPDDIDDPNPPKPTNPMRAFCMWTACSIRDPKAGHMHGAQAGRSGPRIARRRRAERVPRHDRWG